MACWTGQLRQMSGNVTREVDRSDLSRTMARTQPLYTGRTPYQLSYFGEHVSYNSKVAIKLMHILLKE